MVVRGPRAAPPRHGGARRGGARGQGRHRSRRRRPVPLLLPQVPHRRRGERGEEGDAGGGGGRHVGARPERGLLQGPLRHPQDRRASEALRRVPGAARRHDRPQAGPRHAGQPARPGAGRDGQPVRRQPGAEVLGGLPPRRRRRAGRAGEAEEGGQARRPLPGRGRPGPVPAPGQVPRARHRAAGSGEGLPRRALSRHRRLFPGTRSADGGGEDEDLQGSELREAVAGVLQAPGAERRVPDEGGGAGAGVAAHGAQEPRPPRPGPAQAGGAVPSPFHGEAPRGLRLRRRRRCRRRRERRAGDPVRGAAGPDAGEPEPEVATGRDALAGDGAGEGVQPNEDADDQDESQEGRRPHCHQVAPKNVFVIHPHGPIALSGDHNTLCHTDVHSARINRVQVLA